VVIWQNFKFLRKVAYSFTKPAGYTQRSKSSTFLSGELLSKIQAEGGVLRETLIFKASLLIMRQKKRRSQKYLVMPGYLLSSLYC
jgi:hypothetical protein